MENKRQLGWTTLEEAKKLVDAGLDPNTADMCYLSHIDFDDKDFRVYGVDARAYKEKKRETKEFDYVPCWSLGALEKLIPDDIKVNDVTFFYHASYNGIQKWSSSYTNEDLYRQILFHSFQRRIEMLVQTVLFLLENNHIKKHE